MLHEHTGNFTYGKKLIALKKNSFEVSELSNNMSKVTIEYLSFGIERDKNSNSNIKYISMGEFLSFFNVKEVDASMVNYDSFVAGDFKKSDLSLQTNFKVFEDESFWLRERIPIGELLPRVKESHKLLEDFINNGKMPKGYDYWYSH